VTDEQFHELERAGQVQLYSSPQWNKIDNGSTTLKFDLPRHGVSFLKLTW